MTGRSTRKRSGNSSTAASLSMVAERAGVSIATVSRVINGVANKASEATAERVHAAIAELGYRPARAGQALRLQESRIVGVLAATLVNSLMSAIAVSIEWALRTDGLIMALCDTHELPNIQDEYLQEMQSQLARAIVISGAVDSLELDKLRNSGKTLLFVNRPDPGCVTSPYVGIDNYKAGWDVADTLVSHGVRKFALLHGSLDRTAAQWRRKGFLDRLLIVGINEGDVLHATAEGTLNHLEIGYAAMKNLLACADAPRMIVCLSDPIAYGAYRCVREAGLGVPEDFSFFGIDDGPINDWVGDWLNSVGVPAERYGPAVVAALHTLWSGKPLTAPVYLPHEIKIRNPHFPAL